MAVTAEHPPTGEERYRIDDLARLAGSTVRNVRAYQDRGLLPPPRKVGRVGWYSGAHLSRLRLINEMLSRGYTLANISELIGGWVRGQDLSDVLGLEAGLAAPGGEDRSTTCSRAQLRELFEPLGPEHIETAVLLGIVVVEGDDVYRVAHAQLIEAAAVLVEAGVPTQVVFETGAEVLAATDGIAGLYVKMISEYVVGDAAEPLSPEQVRRLSGTVRRFRPLAKGVVDAGLAYALEKRIAEEVGRHLGANIVTTPASNPDGAVTGSG